MMHFKQEQASYFHLMLVKLQRMLLPLLNSYTEYTHKKPWARHLEQDRAHLQPPHTAGTGPNSSAPGQTLGQPLRPHHGGLARALPTHPVTDRLPERYRTQKEENTKHSK